MRAHYRRLLLAAIVLLGATAGVATSGLAQTITEFPLPSGSDPNRITAGPDGALWFTEYQNNKIGRITTAGVVTEFPVPTSASSPQGIAAGTDGALWFTESGTGKIGRITTAGVITEFPIPKPGGGGPYGITSGPDGALWFTDFDLSANAGKSVGLRPRAPSPHSRSLRPALYLSTS